MEKTHVYAYLLHYFMLAYFRYHLSDNYVDLLNLYVDLSVIYVYLSNQFIALSRRKVIKSSSLITFFIRCYDFNSQLLVNWMANKTIQFSDQLKKDLTNLN